MRMLQRILALALAMVLLTAQACAAGLTGATPEEIARAVEDYIAEHEDTMAGLSVAVFNRDTVLHQGYYGWADRESGLPVTADTVMEWGSITKLLVWVSVMQQVEAGRIDLNADVRSYLPEELLNGLTYDEPITMLNLMNHNAGFEEAVVGLMVTDEAAVQPLEEYLCSTQPRQIYAPGTVTAYSNWGVSLAGLIVERVTGISFDLYVREKIFEPQGMENSALGATLRDDPDVRARWETLRFYDAAGKPQGGRHVFIPGYPAGMCVSTLGDLAAFGQALSARDGRLLSPAGWEELFTPTSWYGWTDMPSNCHGLWSKELGCRVMGHGGNVRGSAQLLFDLVSGMGVAVQVNQHNESVFVDGLPEVIFGKGEYPPVEYTGWVRAGRTVCGGAMKLYSLVSTMYVSPEVQTGMEVYTAQPLPKVTMPYGDYLAISAEQAVGELVLTGTYLLAAVGAVVLLICRLVRLILRRGGGNGWSTITAVLIPLPALSFVGIAITLLSSQQWPRWGYQLTSVGIGLVGLALVCSLVQGVAALLRARDGRQRLARGAMLLAVAVTIINIVYWDMYMFWQGL